MLEKKLISFEIDRSSLERALHLLKRVGNILINIELLEEDCDGPEISLCLNNVTIHQVLDILMAKVKHKYYWQQFEASSVVSIIPSEKREDRTYLPNLIVKSFQYEDITPLSCMKRLLRDKLSK